MNDEHELRQILFPLLDALIEGNISVDDHAQLEALLDDSAEARRLYAQYLELDLGIQQLRLSDAQPNAVEELVRQSTQQPDGSRARFVLMGAMMATAVCILIAVFSYPLWRATDSSPSLIANSGEGDLGGEPISQEETKPAIARVMRLIDVQWSNDHKKFSLGHSVEREWLHVSSGIVQLEFSSGAALTLEGPAQLRIDSETECFVQKGKVVVLGPPDLPEFTITSPGSRVIDIGTEFAVVVSETGETDVHVLDGEVDVAMLDNKRQPVVEQRLVESEAATLNPAEGRIESLPFDGQSFEWLRADYLSRNQPLRIQFDCGVHAGLYSGVESPGHAGGDFLPHERFWNSMIGDRTGQLVAADGTLVSGNIEIEFGQSAKSGETVDWDVPPRMPGSPFRSRGVFNTALGEDGIRGNGATNLRFRGLPKGRYRVYLIGRSSNVHPKWGSALADKAYDCVLSVGSQNVRSPSVDQKTETFLIHPLDDADARQWVAGQTHVVGEVTIGGANEVLTMAVNKNRRRSPVPAAGGSPILGVQIMQVPEANGIR